MIMGIIGIIQLSLIFVPLIAEGIMCQSIQHVDTSGTAYSFCDNFGEYFFNEMMLRFFN